jgi:3-dehydroquinate dehydratase
VISPVVDGTITGLRSVGYRLAVDAAATLLEERKS